MNLPKVGISCNKWVLTNEGAATTMKGGVSWRLFFLLSLALLLLVGCAKREEEEPTTIDISQCTEEATGQVASDTASPEATAALEQVLQEIEEKIEALLSYRATFEMIFSEEETVTGEIVFLRPDKMRMKMIIGEDEQTRQELYSDGGTLWQYLPYYNMASKVDLAALKEEFPEEAAALVEGQSDIQGALAEIDKGKIAYLGLEDLDGQSMYVFEGQADASCEMELEVIRIKVWISTADGLQRRVEYYSNEDELIYQHRLENVNVNSEIPDETFHFEPPEDAAVLDATEQSMQVFREMEESSTDEP